MDRSPAELAPRKRPAQARSIALVEAILDASAMLIEADGPGALKTNVLAARAGVSIGSLYQYFPNRDAILASLMARSEAQLRARVEAALIDTGPGDLEAGLRRLIAAAFAHFRASPYLTAILAKEERRLGPLMKEELAGAEERMSALTLAFVRRVLPERGADSEAIAREIEVVGEALVSEALRTGRIEAADEHRIAAILAHCIETA